MSASVSKRGVETGDEIMPQETLHVYLDIHFELVASIVFVPQVPYRVRQVVVLVAVKQARLDRRATRLTRK